MKTMEFAYPQILTGMLFFYLIDINRICEFEIKNRFTL